MDTKERRNAILAKLRASEIPLTGTALAKELGVSRQIIVGDIAILRATGIAVFATPQGYILPESAVAAIRTTLACRHDMHNLEAELLTIIDNGGKVLDVIVEHPVYGEIKANLMLASRRELKAFLDSLATCGAEPLSVVTGGVHLHTIEVPDKAVLWQIEEELNRQGILLK